MNSMNPHPLDPQAQAAPPLSPPASESPTPTEPTETSAVAPQKSWQDYLKDKRVLAVGSGLLALGIGLGGLRLMGGKPTPPVAKADSKIEIPAPKSTPEPSSAPEKNSDPLKLPPLDSAPTIPPKSEEPLKLPEITAPKIIPVKGDEIPKLPEIPTIPDTGFKPAPKPMDPKGNDNEPPLLPGRIKIGETGTDNQPPALPPIGPTPTPMTNKNEPPLTLPPIPTPPETEPKTPKLPDIPTIPGSENPKDSPPKIPAVPKVEPKTPELPKLPENPDNGGLKLPDLPNPSGGEKLPDPPTKKEEVPTLPSLPKENPPIKIQPIDPIKPPPMKIEPIKVDPIDPIKPEPMKPEPIKPEPIKVDSGSKPVGSGNDYEEDLHVVEGRETYSDIAQQYLGKRECAAALERYNQDRKGGNDGVIRIPPEWVLRERYAGLFGRKEEKSPPPPIPSGTGSDLKPAGVSFDPIPKVGDTKIENASDPREYIVQAAQGETLKEIAQRVYGDPNMWAKIFDANERLDINPRLALPKGTRLILPK